MSKDVVFIRRNGRVIPIRKKVKKPVKDTSETKKGLFKVALGAAVGIGASVFASKYLKKSFSLFRKSAELRGISKLAGKSSETRNKFISMAAKKKLAGKRYSNKAKTGFSVGLGIGGVAISSGVSDMFNKDSGIRDEVSGIAGTVASTAIVGLTARKFGIKASGIQELFYGFSKQGRALSRNKLQKISKTKHDKSRKRFGTQMSLFDE